MIPTADVEIGEHPIVTAARILQDATGIAARTGPGASGWVDLHQAEFHVHLEYIVLLYAAHLPDCVPLRSVYSWVQLDGVQEEVLPVIIDSLRRI